MSSFIKLTPAANTIVVLGTYGDSRIGGVQSADRPGVDDVPGGLWQYVYDGNSDGLADGGFNVYGLPIGLTQAMPIQQTLDTIHVDSLSPYDRAARYLLSLGVSKVFIVGGGWGSSHFIGADTTNEPTFKAKCALALAAVQAAYRSARVLPILGFEHGINDRTSDEPAVNLYNAVPAWITDIRSAIGWSTAPIVYVDATPEETILLTHNGALGGPAMRNQVLKANGGYSVQYPTGIGQLHESDLLGTAEEKRQMVRDAGTLHIGPKLAVALGLQTATAPTFSIPDNFPVREGTSTPIPLGCDQYVYFTVASGSVKISGDYEQDAQEVQPLTTWPAYDAGTPSNNNRAYTLNYKTEGGLTGSITRHFVVQQDPLTYLAYDPLTGSDTSLGTGGWRTTPGNGSSGSGKVWAIQDNAGVGIGQISNKRAIMPWTGSNGTYPRSGVDVGSGQVKVRGIVNVTGLQREGYVYACGTLSGQGVQMSAEGHCEYVDSFGGSHSFGTFTPPTKGPHEFGIDVDTTANTATFYLDGTMVLGPIQAAGAPDIPTTDHYAGFGANYINNSITFRHFRVWSK